MRIQTTYSIYTCKSYDDSVNFFIRYLITKEIKNSGSRSEFSSIVIEMYYFLLSEIQKIIFRLLYWKKSRTKKNKLLVFF